MIRVRTSLTPPTSWTPGRCTAWRRAKARTAYVLWFEGIRRLPVTPTALLGLLSPLTAALLGSVIAGEALTSIQLLGFARALSAMSAGHLAPPSSRSSS